MLLSKKCAFILLLCLIDIFDCDDSILNSSESIFEQGQLVFAHILFRHGDRTPIRSYPNDPWADRKYWPEGYGQLTNVGKQQHFKLGKFFRKRYQNLLGDGEYLRDKIYIQSTDVDRTLMSAAANLAGLFPPNDKQTWNKDVLWQPIPIHTVPESLDSVLRAKKPCAKYKYAIEKYMETPEYIKLLEKFKPLFKYLEKNSGQEVRTTADAEKLYNIIWVQHLKNLTLPEWTISVFFPGSAWEWISNYSFRIGADTHQLARLKCGFLIHEIFDRFNEKISSSLSPNRTIWIYSAHDSTVANVLNSLGLFKPHRPPYASSILFELYKTVDNNYYVQIFYKNSTDENLSPLSIPNCGVKCSMENLFRIYEPILPTENFETECRLSLLSMTYKDADFKGLENSLITICLVTATAIIFGITTWRFCIRNRNLKWYYRI